MPLDVSTNDLLDVSGNDLKSSPDSVSGELQYDVVYNAVYDAVLAAEFEQTVTDGQNINSTALSYFQGILNKQIIPKDYVIYVGEPYVYNSSYGGNQYAYEYCLAYGDLSLDGNHFSGNGTIVTIRTQNGYQSVNYEYDQTISLDAPLYYSKSNLGEYSGVVSYNWSSLLILIGMVLGGLVWLFKKLMRLKY